MIERQLYAPVSRAVVCEDRAEVMRCCEIELTEDFCLHFIKLPALTQETRLRAEVEPITGQAKLDELVLERQFDAQKVDPQKAADLIQALKEAQLTKERAEKSMSRCRERVEAAEQMLQSYTDNAKTLLWSEGRNFDFQAIDLLEAELDKEQTQLLSAEAFLDQARAQCQKAENALLPQKEASKISCQAIIRLSMQEPGKVRVKLYSVLPCALWRPAHEAHLQQDGNVTWTAGATVWQNTGEDWHNTELLLSTARTGSRSELPQIESDLVRLCEKADKHQVRLTSRNEARAKEAQSNAPVEQGVYDGGEARCFTISGPQNLASNGLPRMFEIARFTTEAQTRLIATPELSTKAVLVANFINTNDSPLLAGPVTLLYHGANVGQGHIPYCDRGEKMTLGFGSDDRFVIDLKKTVRTEERILQKARRHFVQQVDVFNMGAQSGELELQMRIPQSEFAGLTVHMSEEPPAPADKDGIVRIQAAAAPHSRQTFKLSFYFEQTKDVQLPDPW